MWDKLFGRSRSAVFRNLSQTSFPMRANVFLALSMVLVLGPSATCIRPSRHAQNKRKKMKRKTKKTDDKKDGKKLTAAAERTLSKCLKAKMT